MDAPCANRSRLGVIGGILAVLVGVILVGVVTVRGVSFNALNLVTIIGAVVAGLTLISLPHTGRTLLAAEALLLFAALPAMIGGYGLLLVPSIVLVLIPLLRRRMVDPR